MPFGQIAVLGAIAGATIFLGLPLGRVNAAVPRLKTGLNALATGVLLFLFWDVTSHAWEPVDDALSHHDLGAALSHGGTTMSSAVNQLRPPSISSGSAASSRCSNSFAARPLLVPASTTRVSVRMHSRCTEPPATAPRCCCPVSPTPTPLTSSGRCLILRPGDRRQPLHNGARGSIFSCHAGVFTRRRQNRIGTPHLTARS